MAELAIPYASALPLASRVFLFGWLPGSVRFWCNKITMWRFGDRLLAKKCGYG
jgi:hypothetical protein